MNEKVLEFSNIIGYTFENIDLLERALTHSSHANDAGFDKLHSNERLEFLGDAVLGLTIGELLYDKYPNMTEGNLTKTRAKIICEKSLHEVAQDLDLGDYLFLSKGEICDGGKEKPSILSDAVEAIIGAIYLDGGWKYSKEFIEKALAKQMEHADSPDYMIDSKSKLQRLLQKNGSVDISYKVVDEEGLPHDKIFTVELFCNDELIGIGKGKSKKEAEQDAAKAAIDRKATDVL